MVSSARTSHLILRPSELPLPRKMMHALPMLSHKLNRKLSKRAPCALFGTVWKVNVTVRWSHLSGSRGRADEGLSPAVMNEPAPALRTADRLRFVFQLRLDSQISNQSVEVVGVDAENPRRVRVALPRAAKGVTDETYLRIANRIVEARQIRPP